MTRLQQAQNQIVVDVRTAQINLQQARAALEAAQATVKYQQQAVEATEKEFQFGTSSAFTVVQQQQLLATDAGSLVRAEVNLVEDKVQFDRAMGRTFTVNNISVESARKPDEQLAADSGDDEQRATCFGARQNGSTDDACKRAGCSESTGPEVKLRFI